MCDGKGCRSMGGAGAGKQVLEGPVLPRAVLAVGSLLFLWFSGVAGREFKKGKMLMLSVMFSIPKLSQDCPQFSLRELAPLPLPKQSCLLLIIMRDLQWEEGGFSLPASHAGGE